MTGARTTRRMDFRFGFSKYTHYARVPLGGMFSWVVVDDDSPAVGVDNSTPAAFISSYLWRRAFRSRAT
eukprot:CAMPEP_0116867064 /NCGR_PEP_ID=MMETSP0418-20121206/26404_1 /TAXON_ID=1158023 /ORGANISM="Astrosyne radiata, Strain 13vi08-1A" /LENGTH=68 /DNA_ID=CAMNT_0004502823 /DNA_START=218 /DNA_END=424 /DNA_ORIENTATION=+